MPTYRFIWSDGYAAHMTPEQYDTACEIAHKMRIKADAIIVDRPDNIDTAIMFNDTKSGLTITVLANGTFTWF